MAIFINFLPILLFVTLFFGSGLFFSIAGYENAFYLLPATSAILPSLVLAWLLSKGDTNSRMHRFLDGARHPDVITMCLVFLLAGSLSTVTKSIGSVDSTVSFALTIIPESILVIGVFLIAALISTAIGSSMGTIAALGVIVAELAAQGAFPVSIGIATLVGGAMFGDNMSVISDTTIASISSQEASLKEKLKLNIRIALIASVITIGILLLGDSPDLDVADRSYSLLLISPYALLIIMAAFGVNVFIVLVASLAYSGLVGVVATEYSLIKFAQDISSGFASMNEIMILSIFVGGLSGLSGSNSKELVSSITKLMPVRAGKRAGELLIGGIVSVFDILLANNVIAIVFSGEIAREIAAKYRIKPHESAAWLDIFSCVFQGIIPHGAQILLAAAIAGISPLEVVGKVYYCYVLGGVTILYILTRRQEQA